MTNEQRKDYLEEQLIMLRNQIESVSKELDKVNDKINYERLLQKAPRGADAVYADGSYIAGHTYHSASGGQTTFTADGGILEK